MYYLLDKDNVPYRTDNSIEWAHKIQSQKRVRRNDVGCFNVSTVFLGIDHSFGGDHAILFETMIFRNSFKLAESRAKSEPSGMKLWTDASNGGVDDDLIDWNEDYCDRYSTFEEAVAGHAVAMKWAARAMRALSQMGVENVPTT